jgi:plasmid stabilization system protein ParE
LAKGCRSARHEKHIIFFSIKGQTLQVIRILHEAMDFNNHLAGEDLPG